MTTELVEIPDYIVGTWSIDPVHSYVGFIIRHVMVSKVRGSFTRFEGQLVTTASPLDSTVTATIDLTSIETGSEERDEHIRSADFFEADTYPTMTYASTGIRRDGNDLILDGNLTLKGVTLPVPLHLEPNGFGPDPFASDPEAGARAGFSATGEIDRTNFGVDYNGPIPGGGMALGNRVQLILEVEAFLQY